MTKNSIPFAAAGLTLLLSIAVIDGAAASGGQAPIRSVALTQQPQSPTDDVNAKLELMAAKIEAQQAQINQLRHDFACHAHKTKGLVDAGPAVKEDVMDQTSKPIPAEDCTD